MKLRCFPPCACYSWGYGMQADRLNWFKGWAHVHCVSLVANKLPLCFWVWFYAFSCCNDESTGKLCNDRGKPLPGERKITLKRWGCQAASGHNASFCVSEKLATGTAGNGYSSPVIKTMDADHSDTNQWFNHCINETDDFIGFGGFEPTLCSSVLPLRMAWPSSKDTHFPQVLFILRLSWLQLYTKIYWNIIYPLD